jgi:uncharacterized cupin superfamily protein/glyoxylase-like metal-dependent hydrolase (beta-lactamase superfamily II)
MQSRVTGVSMQDTVVAGIAMWSLWQPERGVNFNSWLVTGDGGAFVVDPLEPDDDTVFERCRSAGVRAVVVTNRDHERAANRFARELGVPIIAPAADAAQLGVTVDRAVGDGDDIFGWRVLVLDGYKTPGEMVLYSRERRAAISGDAFWGAPAGALRLMPDEKLADPVRAILSARRVRALPIEHLLVGDGMPIFGNAVPALTAMIAARAADAPVEVVNVSDLLWRADLGDPAPFTAEMAEIGLLIGAQRLGVAAGRIGPGQSYAPLHWHTREEELFIVWEGHPTLRTPAASRRLKPGDCIVFVTDPGGAHRLSNETDAPCTVVMIANLDAGDVCFYPDSNKFVVETTGTLVRATPLLDYFDGE